MAAEGTSNYVIARHVMGELAERGEPGRKVLRRIVTELANMTKPEATALDQAAGKRAIDELMAVAR